MEQNCGETYVAGIFRVAEKRNPMKAEPKQPSFSELRSAFLKRLLAFALIANLLIAGLAAFLLVQSKKIYENRAQTTTQNLARSLADHIAGELTTIDLTLLLVCDEVEEELARGRIDPDELNTFLARHRARLHAVDGLRIAAADGYNSFGTRIPPGTRISIADRPYFIQLRDNPNAGLVISDPMVRPNNNQPAIILARRISHPNGAFAGVVSGAVTLKHFTTTFSAIDVGAHGSIALRNDRLGLIARLPEPAPELAGKTAASPDLRNRILQRSASGTYRNATAFDKVERTYSYYKVANSALYVIVGLASQDYLADWYWEANWTMALVLIFALGTGLSASLIYRGFMRQALAMQTLAQQEQSLRESEARFRSLLHEVHNVAVQGCSADGTTQYWNKASERLYGYTAQEAIGRKLVDLIIPPQQRHQVQQEIIQMAATAQPGPSAELSVMRKDGSSVSVLSNHVIVQVPGRPQELFCISIDLTSRKHAEEALRKSQAELEAISNSTPVMMCLVNSQHKVEQMNRAMTEFTKDTVHKLPCSVGGLLGCVNSLTSGCGLATECETCPLRTAVHKTVASGQPCRQVELPIVLQKNGMREELFLSASTTLVKLGEETKTLVCLENITVQKQLASQLFQAQKMDAIGQLAGGVAHDFNNILAAFLMNVGLLKTTPDLPPDVLSGLDELEELTQRATRLTRQLLVFSRRQVVQSGRLDMQKLVTGLMKMLGRLLGEHIEISQSSSEGLWVDADAGMMEQVVLNLCVNARDAMPKGGRLTLALETVAVDREQAREHHEGRPGQFVCLSVTDTGCGMDELTVKRIFEPFFTTKAVGKGTGLGLATVYGIVKQHKGWIEVTSAPGCGTTFRVFLPVSKESEHEPAPASHT